MRRTTEDFTIYTSRNRTIATKIGTLVFETVLLPFKHM